MHLNAYFLLQRYTGICIFLTTKVYWYIHLTWQWCTDYPDACNIWNISSNGWTIYITGLLTCGQSTFIMHSNEHEFEEWRMCNLNCYNSVFDCLFSQMNAELRNKECWILNDYNSIFDYFFMLSLLSYTWALTWMKDCRLMVSENRVLRRIFRCKQEEVWSVRKLDKAAWCGTS
jgi:hypothetical protein